VVFLDLAFCPSDDIDAIGTGRQPQLVAKGGVFSVLNPHILLEFIDKGDILARTVLLVKDDADEINADRHPAFKITGHQEVRKPKRWSVSILLDNHACHTVYRARPSKIQNADCIWRNNRINCC
jgi:hypothetical protein